MSTGLPSQQQSSAAPSTTETTLPPSGTTAVASPGLTPGQSVSSTLPNPVGVPLVPAGVAGVPLLPPPDLGWLVVVIKNLLLLMPCFLSPHLITPLSFSFPSPLLLPSLSFPPFYSPFPPPPSHHNIIFTHAHTPHISKSNS